MGILNIRWMVNAVLVAIPIGVTLGTLGGLDAHKKATGQDPVFSTPNDGGTGGSGSSGGGNPNPSTPKTRIDGVTYSQYCQKSVAIAPKTKGLDYTFNPNQWGWNATDGGGLCMNITTFDNNTYATTTTAPQWSVTWEYPQGPETQPVHAYPNVRVETDSFPAMIEDLEKISIDFEWTYGVGNASASTTSVSQLTAKQINANVALDLFLDANKNNAQDNTKASHEIMVWFADFGESTQPIGLKQGAVLKKTLDNVTFNLYYGQNSLEQYVLTWLASEPAQNFTGDIAPLITDLLTVNHANFPTSSDYLGYMSIGSEAYWSESFATFSVKELSVDISTKSS